MDNPITSVMSAFKRAMGGGKPDQQDPGPGDVGPTTQTKDANPNNLVTLKMTSEEVGEWWKRVERARGRVRAREEKWDILLNEYLPMVEKSGTPESVKVQQHFRNVHSKIGQLFYRQPDLVLTPDDPSAAQDSIPNPMQQPGGPPMPPLTLEDIISVKQAVLTKKLGRDGIKVNRLMDELLFDVLAWAGIGCAKVGYRCVMQSIPTASTTDPAVPAEAAPVPVPIFEEYYVRRFSPKKLLFNDDLRSTRYDEDATWMGMEFYMSPKRAMKELGLSEDEANKAASDDRVHEYDEDKQGSTKPLGLVHGIELWVKASVFTDEQHPQAMNQLVLVESVKDRPVVWRPSPDQEFDPMTRRLTEDSLIGFPIRVLTVRDLADSPFPMADSAFTNSEIKQLSTWRRQSIKIRDAAIGKYFYDTGAFDDTDIEKLKGGDVGEYVGVAEGKLAQGADKVFTTTAQVHQTQDDYQGQAAIKHDIDETLGISSVQAGTQLQTVHTATEVADVQAAIAARNGKERDRVVDYYIDIVRMVDQLLMRYADQNEYVHIAGEDGARRMQMWNNHLVSGRWLYEIAPDSQHSPDNAQDFQQDLNFYNQAAKDPLFNRGYILRRMARRRGMDPGKTVIDQSQLPKAGPHPNLSVAVKALELTDPVVQQVLEAYGLLPQKGQSGPAIGQPPHGGANTPGEVVSQHSASNSGGKENAPGSVDHRAQQVK